MNGEIVKISLLKRTTCLFLFCFIFLYFVVTLFFVLPDNSLNIEMNKQFKVFDLHFFQRWAFFAPPATYNENLRISFYSENQVETFDILRPLLVDKQAKTPFNREFEIIDYLMSNTIAGIQDNVKYNNDLINFRYNKAKKKISNDMKTKLIVDAVEKSNDFLTLKKYANIVAKKNLLPLKNLKFQIYISKTDMPQFADREKKLFIKEVIMFQSSILNLTND